MILLISLREINKIAGYRGLRASAFGLPWRTANDYVFQGTGRDGHIIEPRKQMAHVIKATGIHFTVHDLRRTFITIAESLDIPAYALKRLMNHKMTNDVTAGYIVAIEVHGIT